MQQEKKILPLSDEQAVLSYGGYTAKADSVGTLQLFSKSGKLLVDPIECSTASLVLLTAFPMLRTPLEQAIATASAQATAAFAANDNGVIVPKIGYKTKEGLVVAAMYDDPKTKQQQIVLTTQEHLSDWATWFEGKKMIEAFNEKGEYKGHDIKHYGEFDYAGGRNKDVDVLYMMYQNQKEIGGFEPTENNKYGRTWGKVSNYHYAAGQNFDQGARLYINKTYKAAIRPVVVLSHLTI